MQKLILTARGFFDRTTPPSQLAQHGPNRIGRILEKLLARFDKDGKPVKK